MTQGGPRDRPHGSRSQAPPTGETHTWTTLPRSWCGIRRQPNRISRRSCPGRPYSREQIMRLLEAARLAPSACNRQPWRFAVALTPEVRRRIVEDGFLPGLGMSWAREAPVHVVLGMERSVLTHGVAAAVAGVDYPWLDLGIAGEHPVLAAAELGLGTCWIGWIRPRILRRIVGWPVTVRPVAVITVGYPRDADPRSTTGSRRRPMDELLRWL